MAGMGGMQGGIQSELFNLGINGVQNTNKQEYNQRQALYQNLVAAMDDSAWLQQHYPNFFGWNAQGGGGGGYEAGSNAPQSYAGKHYDPNVAQSNNQMANARSTNAQTDFDEWQRSKYREGYGDTQPNSGGFSGLWS